MVETNRSAVPRLGGVGARLRRRPSADGRSALTGFCVLLLLIPAVLVFGPLGAAGSPAVLCGLGLLAWWLCVRMVPGLPIARGYQPVRIAVAVFAVAVVLSYLYGSLSALTGTERSGADRGLLMVASWSGIALVAADLLRARRSIETLLKRLVVLGAVIAAIGVLQFTSVIDIAGAVKIPGLSVNGVFQTVQTGGPVRRVAGTASHPIEYGMVLALILPFAFHYTFAATRRKGMWWLMTILIGVALPMSLSRSAILAVAAELIVLFWIWPPRRRLAAVAVAPVFLVALRLVIPGLVGTMVSLFSNAANDPSLQGRADSRSAAGALIIRSPWLGRGFNTYIPANFLELGLQGVNHGSLDNQYLGSMVEMGAVGLIALIMLLLVSMGVARGIRARSSDPETRNLGQAFFAAFLATAIGMATFDGLGFAMFTGLFMLLLGTAGALWRVTKAEYDSERRLVEPKRVRVGALGMTR